MTLAVAAVRPIAEKHVLSPAARGPTHSLTWRAGLRPIEGADCCVSRYVRSLDSKQLGGKNGTSSACDPIQYLPNGSTVNSTNGGRINPCGLIAWSNFNDTFAVSASGRNIAVDVSHTQACHLTQQLLLLLPIAAAWLE